MSEPTSQCSGAPSEGGDPTLAQHDFADDHVAAPPIPPAAPHLRWRSKSDSIEKLLIINLCLTRSCTEMSLAGANCRCWVVGSKQ